MTEDEFATHEWWNEYKERVNNDEEMAARGHDFFDENFYVEVDGERYLIEVSGGKIDEIVPNPGVNHEWSFGVEGSREAWREFIEDYPPAHNNEIIASNYRTAVRDEEGYLTLTGNNKRIFQNLRPFQRALDLMRENPDGGIALDVPEPEHGEFESITGGYVGVEIEGVTYRVYYEEAGPEDGIPLMCQHTAGNHGHEWRHVLTDDEITEDFRVIAYDLPYHGKSVPPTSREWWKEDYMLTEDRFAESIVSIADALDLEKPVYMGSSIGGNIALQLGDWHPDRFRALIALECGTYSPGYFLDWFQHPQVNIAEVSAYACWGLMAPQGPEAARRETMHLYEQGSNGLFRGDLYFYSVDHDYRDKLDQVEPEYPIYVMNGEYDFATNPDDAREVAEGVAGEATAIEMAEIGHFPMSENPVLFNAYLKRVLDEIKGEDVDIPEKLTPEEVGIDLPGTSD